VSRRSIFRIFLYSGISVALLLNSNLVLAGGFELWEESAAGTADYHAGGAAEANDAGTTFYNPAGMIRLPHPQVSVGTVYIPLSTSFNGTVGQAPFPILSTTGYVPSNTYNLVPNAHFVLPFNNWVAVGIGLSAPFGLATNFPGNSQPLANAATLTKLETININPDIAFALDDKLSVGAGFDALYGKAKFNSVLLRTTEFLNTAAGWGFGWNVGGLYQFTPHTRIGASYRSQITVHGEGQSQALIPGVITLTTNTLNAEVKLPSLTIASFYSDVTSRWSLLASAYFTAWDVFNEIVLNNTAIAPTIPILENYRNTWNYAIGTHFRANRIFTLKAGIGWDETPTQIGFRDVRLPDCPRFVTAIGGHVQPTRYLGIDVGWTHFFTVASMIDNSQSGVPAFEITQGTGVLNANVYGLQLTVDID
jgi:long-chain fatty acid transport protein